MKQKGVSTRIAALSDRALAYYESLEDKSGTLAGLVELAAADNRLAVWIANALERMEAPDRGTPGRKEIVSDDRLMELKNQGLTQAEIANAVGMSRTQVGNRIRRIRENSDK